MIFIVEKGPVRPFLLSFLGLLAVQPPFPAHAGTVVKLSHSETAFAGLSVSHKESLPAGWKYLPAVDLYLVDEEGQDALDRWQRDGAVQAAEEGFDIQLEAVPNDPYLGAQGWVDDQDINIGALEAWDLLEEGEPITVAIIDTGIDTRHPDLAPNLWINDGEVPENGLDDDKNGFVDDAYGYNFWDDSGDVTDPNSHGSHMAGIIGAVGDNGLGIAGVAWNARLMTLRFTDAEGNGTSSKAIEAIDYAIRNGAKVINASWTLKTDGDPGVLLRYAIQKAAKAGILFVTAAGNQFRTNKGLDLDEFPIYPAAFRTENMIVAAALDARGELAPYSNFGRSSVHLVAPGGLIVSTSAEGGYLAMSGTSMAAAFVSGAAALVYSSDSDLSPVQVKAVLEGSVTAHSSLEDKVATGGLINLFGALSAVRNHSIPETPVTSVSSNDPETPSSSDAVSLTGGGCSLIKETSGP